jgi:hypothetical protein
MNESKRPKFYNLVGHGGEVVPDMLCCEGCGYGVCSCPAEPPEEVLPEGWRECPSGGFEHVSKAYVYAPCPESWHWWTSADVAAEVTDTIHDPKPTRDAAMQAALASVQPDTKRREPGCQCHLEEGDSPCRVHDASVQPAQPELRPGWKLVDPSHPSIGYIHSSGGWVYRQEGGVYREERGLYAARGSQTDYDYDHPTLEAAMQRAEALARGES